MGNDTSIESIELTGTLTFGDILRYQYSQCYRRTWWIVLLGLLVSLAFVVLAALVVVLTADFQFARKTGTPFLLLFLFWTWIAIVPYISAKKQMKTNILLTTPINFVFSSQGIHRSGSHFSGELSYEALWAVGETKSFFLLYLSAVSAVVLPKRFFESATQQRNWRALIEEKTSPKKITKRGFLGRWL